MKIEARKFYRTRDGRRIGPMTLWHYSSGETDECFPWSDTAELDDRPIWADDGRANGKREDDLIEELVEEETGPVRTVTRKEIVPGTYGCVRVIAKPTNDPFPDCVHVRIDDGQQSASDLRNAAEVLTKLADALEDQK